MKQLCGPSNVVNLAWARRAGQASFVGGQTMMKPRETRDFSLARAHLEGFSFMLFACLHLDLQLLYTRDWA